jgi:hypothetical protein
MPKRLLAALACTCAAACSTSPGDYPSLAVRDAERVSGTMEPAEAYVAPPVSEATIETAQDLYGQAMEAHESFFVRYRAAQPVVSAARGAGVGTEAWAQASVAIADVETERSKLMVLLAELDRLYVAATTEGSEPGEIEAAQARVSEAAAEETAKIDEMLAVLAR